MKVSIYTSIIASMLAVTGCEKQQPEPTQSELGTTTGTTSPTTPYPGNTYPTTPARAPDNTANNRQDASGDTRTPLDQSEASEDIRITAAIRRAILDEEGMSMNGQNCKVITQAGGIVTLRGVVDNQAEKDRIDVLAKAVTGVTRVDNQLEVKTR